MGEARPEPYYGAADIVVLPSYFDTFGLVILEGLACGLPVITSTQAGGHEIITPGREGVAVADPSDSAMLAHHVGRFEDRQVLAEASKAARALALDHTLERQYREIMEAIAPIAHKG